MQGRSSFSLKRGATSLSDEFRCHFCSRVFSAPHQLDKHEKTSCQASKKNLSDLLKQARGLRLISEGAEQEGSKRRRLDTDGRSESTLGGSALRNQLHPSQRSDIVVK